MRNPTDGELMRLIREGQQHALTELYDRHAKLVYSIAYRIAGNEPLAREAVQLVYTRLWTTKADYDASKGVFSSWLITITRNITIDVLRCERRHRSIVPIVDANVAATGDGAPEEALERSDRQSAIATASRSLSTPQRRVIDLLYWKGYTLKEIAEMGGEPVGTVKNRLHQALKTLRRHLQGLKEER
ncbi:sigma-70 family RNA polymerase sigma factor [Cohnella endophytica]|uniref:Sigma-70 family RNA polymerase sigma factor n=1 Tax=Cohnella endophytica TaxID=2419778 RepID=A0A494Y2H2_9BACL|nr:sigma-70 family RNA polymerase sigma factor [Cohnella endophytica]RKP56899.1 sigma-70 family RNA polymerase sigma factor [Cohnella endophytica]